LPPKTFSGFPTPTPPTGFIFAGWVDGGGNPVNNGDPITQQGDFTLYADYQPEEPPEPDEYPIKVHFITLLPGGDVELAWEADQLDVLDPSIRTGNYHYVVSVCSDLLLWDWMEHSEVDGSGNVLALGARSPITPIDRTVVSQNAPPLSNPEKGFYKVKVVKD
jgi:uncharacterized repeat protein (TIGR02543 family)